MSSKLCLRLGFLLSVIAIIESGVIVEANTKREENFDTGDSSPRAYDLSRNIIDPKSSLIHQGECGKARVRIKRVTGGRDSSYGRRPWQAALFDATSERPFCGGTLINDRWIITAAHCVIHVSIKTLTVRLGEVNAQKKHKALRNKEFKVVEKKVHSRYVSDERYRYDIALLKLAKTVHFGENIIPVCLPKPNLNLNGRRATVSGWGYKIVDEEIFNPAILNEVDVKVISNRVCESWFLKNGHVESITNVFICAGYSNGGRDSCAGDSGGPLTTSVNGKEVLIGIVSWGYECGGKYSPGLYTNVKKFVPWMREQIGQ